jgi:hypothetical protein
MVGPKDSVEPDDEGPMIIKVPDIMGVVERAPTKKKVA